MCNGYDHRLQNPVDTGCDFSSTTFRLSTVFKLGSLHVDCKITAPTCYACWVGLREQVHVSIFARCPALDIFTFTLTLSD